MARTAKKPDVFLAPSLITKTLHLLRGLLIGVGKPFYYLLAYSILALFYFLFSIGRLTSHLVGQAQKFSFAPPKIKLPAFPTLPRLNIKLAVTVVVLASISFLVWFYIFRDLPSPRELTQRKQEVSTKIYDRNRVLLYTVYKDKNRTPVGLNEIPYQVRVATLAAEDAEFYNHLGFSVKGITRSIVKNLKEGELTGGSTITQQLVKNALLTPEKTLIRKLREIILSIGVELTFSKDEILQMYLNEVSYGGTAYGIAQASRVYFGKDVENLNLAEAALLAGLPKSPTKFSPFGANPELTFARQREVLRLMVINKYITDEDYDDALKQPLSFAPNRIDIKAPHFVMYVRQELERQYGPEVVETGGLEVITTLDYQIQQMTEAAVKTEVAKLTNLHVTNGAALVIKPRTGEILAMVGSKDYFDLASDGNVNVTTSQRQPGSSIKIVNYAYALANGYSPASILDDSPITFSVPGQPPYSPRNYDGTYRGKINLRSALAESRNVPAVKVLASYGVEKMIDLGEKLGITTWQDRSRYGLSLTLGGGEIKLIELAGVYATVANYGKKVNPQAITKVTNYEGKILRDNNCFKIGFDQITKNNTTMAEAAGAAKEPCGQEGIIAPTIAYLLIDILKDNAARAPAFGLNSSLVIPEHPEVAVKTGTSNDLKDNLTFGFNQDYLVAVWVGNNDATPMARIASGITGASPIFNKIMRTLLYNQPSRQWGIPDGIKKISICSLTGTLPCSGCPINSEWFLSENLPQKACLYQNLIERTEKNSPQGQILEPAARTEAN